MRTLLKERSKNQPSCKKSEYNRWKKRPDVFSGYTIYIKASKSIGCDNHDHGIYHITKSVLSEFITNKYLTDDNISAKHKYDDESKIMLAKDILRYKSGNIDMLGTNSIFSFEENSESSISMKFDKNWTEESVYKSEDLPINLDPTTSLEQLKIADTKKEIQK